MEAVQTHKPADSKSKSSSRIQRKTGFVQPKLQVSKANDSYEKEADHMADKVVGKSAATNQTPLAKQVSPLVQRKEEEVQTKMDEEPIQKKEEEVQTKMEKEPVQKKEEELQTKMDKEPVQKKEEEVQAKLEEEPVQKKDDEVQTKKVPKDQEPEDYPFVEEKLKDTRGQGSPLSTGVLQELQSQFGVKLDTVRIHTGEAAVQMNRALGAQAFTNGKDIYFNEGRFNPFTSDGKHLLAHEMTHTIQQGAVAEKAEDKKKEILPIQLNPQLDQAIAIAVGERGKVNAKAKNPDGTRVGYEHLLKYFKTAFGANWDGSLEANIKTYTTTASNQVGVSKDAMPSWCGIFIWWAYKTAGIPITDWQLGVPMGANIGNYPAPHVPLAGDIGQKVMHQHFAMVLESDGKTVKTINGNTAGSDNLGGQIEEKTEPASAFAVYYNPLGGKLNGTVPDVSEEDLPQPTVKVETPESNVPFSKDKELVKSPKVEKAKGDKAKNVKGKKKEAMEEPGKPKKVKIAPKSPEKDPAFQAMKKRTKATSSKVQQHEPATKKQADAANAAVGPANEVESKAQENQTDEFAAHKPAVFDASGFKKALKAKLEEITPKNLEEADEFKEKGKTEDVKKVATDGVKAEKEKTAGPTEEKNREPLNTTGIAGKEVVPLTETPVEPTPMVASPKDAAPKKRSEEEYTSKEESQRLNTPLEENNISESQLIAGNEPAFAQAVETKNTTQNQVVNSESEFRQEEKITVKKAENQAVSGTENTMQDMLGTKNKNTATIATTQQQSKTKDELERQKIANDINGIFTKTKNNVDEILTTLDTHINTIFDQGSALAKLTFEKDVDKKMSDYKDRRYSGLRGKARWVKDKFFDLPSEVNRFYEESRDQYIKDMDVVIDTVANIVATKLTEAQKAVTNGKTEIKKYVENLPKNLQKYGKESAESMESKFEELEQSINDKQSQLVDNLAQKYKENLAAVDARITELKEANKGLISKAKDAIVGVVKTILELKNMLLNILAKAISVIDKIITDPIGFLKNLVAGIKTGLNNFIGNIWKHLKEGFISWLTGSFGGAGIQFPDTWDLKGIFTFVMSLLGLTWDNIRMRAVKKLGEPVVKALETAFEIFQIIRKDGLAGLWNYIKEKIGDLKVAVWDAVQNFIVEKVITAGITWVLGLLNPAGAFIKACKLIYDIVIFFVENAKRLIDLVNAVIDSVVDVAKGAIGGAAKKIEDALAKLVPIAIGFLAALVGVGGVSKKVKDIIEKIRKPINKAIDWVLDQAVKVAKKLGLDKLVKGAKNLLAKLFEWWKMKTGFSTPSGKKHTLSFKGDKKNGKLTVASTPTPIEKYISDIIIEPKHKADRDEALKIAKTIHKETAKEYNGKDEAAKKKFDETKEATLKSEFSKLKYRLSKLPDGGQAASGEIPEVLQKYTTTSVLDENGKLKGEFMTALVPTNYYVKTDGSNIRVIRKKAEDKIVSLFINKDTKLEIGSERDYVPDHKNYKPENIKVSQTKGVYTAEYTTKTYDGKAGPSYSVDISFEEIIKDAPNRKETRVVSGKSLVFKPEGNPRGVTDSAKSGFDNAHLIGDRFGGSGYNQALNIYPSSPDYNRKDMLGIENAIAEKVKGTSGYDKTVTAIIESETTSNLEKKLREEFSHDNKTAVEGMKNKADTEITKTLRTEIAKDIEGLPGKFVSVKYKIDKPHFGDGLGEDAGYNALMEQYKKENVNSGTTIKKAS